MASRGDKQKTGLEGVAAMVAGAGVVPLRPASGDGRDLKSHAAKPKPSSPGSIPDGDELRQTIARNRLPDNCPVVPLGTFDGHYYYLDELRQIRTLKPKEHEKKSLESLFGRRSDLCQTIWPRHHATAKNDDGSPVITGWKPEEAGRVLMAACADRGIWRAQGRVRGAGAHRGDYGELILHCGDKIFEGRQYREPGLIGEFVYPAAEPTPRFDAIGAGTDVGHRSLAMLSNWSWARGSLEGEDVHAYGVDAVLLLGFLAGATVCGALEWRPAVWLTGGRGTGKSHLQLLIRGLLGGKRGLLDAANATEAYLRQLLGMRTLPVALDELEASADNRKAQAIIELARIASSGGTMGRGGQDHNPHEFTMRSAFLFSSILIPPLAPQDRSRLAILELNELPRGAEAPVLDPEELAQLGRGLRRRMVDGWERLPETIERFKRWLAEYGHDARMQDQFGTLLACADLCLFDHATDFEDYYRRWAELLDARHLAEKAEDASEGELAAHMLRSSQLQAVGGAEPMSVSMFIEKGLGCFADQPPFSGINENAAESARRRLETIGLKLVSSWEETKDGEVKRRVGPPAPLNPDRPVYVAVANRHTGLDRLYRNENARWSGGVWSQALRRIPGAVAKHNVKIGGANEWSVLVPIAVFVSIGDGDGEAGA